MNAIAGVGKDAPTVVNEKGGKQSKVLYRFDLLDPQAMFKMTEVLGEGAEKYGDFNWRNVSVRDHLNHLIAHTYAYLAGDTSDDHLSHIMCRAMFAQGVDIDDNCNFKTNEKMPESDGSFFRCLVCNERSVPIEGYGVHLCTKCGIAHRVVKGGSYGPDYALLDGPAKPKTGNIDDNLNFKAYETYPDESYPVKDGVP